MPNTAQVDKAAKYKASENAWDAGWKLHYETAKHITTLSIGSILILIALLEKMFVRPVARGLIISALALLVLSIIMSVMVRS